MSAEFKVIKIDPEGSGMDYANHLGATIYRAKRCCSHCTVIFGSFVSTPPLLIEEYDPIPVGPFVHGELSPLNEEACEIIKEIEKDHPWTAPEKTPSLSETIKNFFVELFK